MRHTCVCTKVICYSLVRVCTVLTQIASCEVCSLGLGGKRRSKPPSQKRDVRPPQKLQKLTTCLTMSGSLVTSTPPSTTVSTSSTSQTSHGSMDYTLPLSRISIASTQMSHTASNTTTHSSLDKILPSSSGTVKEASSALDLADTEAEHSAASGLCLKVDSLVCVAPEPVAVSDTCGFQIFTTINEPYEHREVVVEDAHSEELVPSKDHETISTNSSSEEQYTCTLENHSSSVLGANSQSSIYQMLFELPSEPNISMYNAVVSF